MNSNDRKNLLRFLDVCNKDEKVLDIGCGIGNNLTLLKKLGFSSIYGVDISEKMIKFSKNLGFNNIYKPEELPKDTKFDILLMSHVIEHLNYPEIKSFFEFYLSKLNKNGKLIILTPTIYNGFYSDIDHIKPYNINSILNLFTSTKISRSYSSSYKIKLTELKFRKEPLTPYNLVGRFLKKSKFEVLKFRLLDFIFRFLYFISGKMISKTTGYIALFEVG